MLDTAELAEADDKDMEGEIGSQVPMPQRYSREKRFRTEIIVPPIL